MMRFHSWCPGSIEGVHRRSAFRELAWKMSYAWAPAVKISSCRQDQQTQVVLCIYITVCVCFNMIAQKTEIHKPNTILFYYISNAKEKAIEMSPVKGSGTF